jgi:GT2 family glycosyltransferase
VKFEIIIVDNASTDGTYKELVEQFGETTCVSIVFSEINLGASGGRNLGAKTAKGDYLLFIDSDNVIHDKMVVLLCETMFFSEVGMVGPLMLYGERPDRVWTYFADINPWTSRASYLGNKEEATQNLPDIIVSGHIPNCFMVRRADFEKVRGFDEYYFVMYEEADLAERIKKYLGKQIVIDTRALTYHHVAYEQNLSDGYSLGIRDPIRAYLLARNRIHFVKKNFEPIQKIFFFLVMNNVTALFYCFHFVRANRFGFVRSYLKGMYDGILGL